MANELPHGERPLDANLPTELSKTLACFDTFPEGETLYNLTVPVYGDRPTFSAKIYADGEVEGALRLYKSGDEHRTMTIGVAVGDLAEPMGLPVTRYGDTFEIPTELQALKFREFFITFQDDVPQEIMGRTPGGEEMCLPDIGCSVFPGDRLSENHYFYYVMRFILGLVSKSKEGLHISPAGIMGHLAVVAE